MPNTKSNIKRVRSNKKRQERNAFHKATLKTALKKARLSVKAQEENAEDTVATAVKALDHSVSKGIIHKNTAARKKSRLQKAFNNSTK